MTFQSHGYTFNVTEEEVLIMKEGTSSFFMVPIEAIRDLSDAVAQFKVQA